MTATAAMLMGSCTPAFAYVSSGTEEQLLTETADGAGEDASGEAANGNAADAGQNGSATEDANAVTEHTEAGTAFSVPALLRCRIPLRTVPVRNFIRSVPQIITHFIWSLINRQRAIMSICSPQLMKMI